jgi:hypothetical protein
MVKENWSVSPRNCRKKGALTIAIFADEGLKVGTDRVELHPGGHRVALGGVEDITGDLGITG